MSSKTLNLEALDQVLKALFREANDDCKTLAQVLRGFYKEDEDLAGIESVSARKVLDQWYENQDDTGSLAARLLKLEATKEQINSLLLKLAEENSNPLGLIVSDQNTWIRYRRRAFKQSEIEFKVPETLHDEFQRHLSLVQRQSEEEQQKIDSLTTLEDSLARSRQQLEEEKATFRASLNKQVMELQSTLSEEREVHAREIGRLQGELNHLRESQSALSSEHQSHLEVHVEGKLKAEQEFMRQSEDFAGHFEKLSELVQELAEEAGHYTKTRQQQTKRLAQQEQNYRKNMRRYQTLLRQGQSRQTELSEQYKTLRSNLEKQYREKVRELQHDFKRQANYFLQRKDEEEEDRRALADERTELIAKKQSLSQEAQSRVEDQFKKRQAELEQQSSQLQEGREMFLKLGKKLSDDKKKLAEKIRVEKGGRFALTELQGILEEQEKALEQIRELGELLESQRKENETRVKVETQNQIKEQKELLEEIKREREEAADLLTRVKKREQELINRETNELVHLHEEYEDLKLSLEVSQIEKDARHDKREKEIEKKESETLDRLKEQVELYEETRKQILAQEEEVQTELEEMLSLKLEISQLESDTRHFLEETRHTFQRRLSQQTMDFEAFKTQMELLQSEAIRLKENLAQSSESSEVERTSREETLTERIQQHENLMETLEETLNTQVAQYREQVSSLQEKRRELSVQEREQMKSMLSNLSNYEEKLHQISTAFEQLSEAFQQEKRLGGVQILEDDEPPPFTMEGAQSFSEEMAQGEWQRLLKQLAEGPVESRETLPPFLETWSARWNQWLDIPGGDFWMGREGSHESAPFKQFSISGGLKMAKYPVTNVEFMKFVLATGYRTEAELYNGGIVYYSGIANEVTEGTASFRQPSLEPVPHAFWWCPDGNPDTLSLRHHHPVTQVTWNDVAAYCTWKSDVSGKTVRLATEAEWEYIASNFGQETRDLPWDTPEALSFCNVEESGLGTTTPVDFYGDHEFTGGAQDLFGNVYEWVLDGSPPKGRSKDLDYRLVRGGGFLTLLEQVARWRRLAFVSNYRTSFIGFRVVIEND